MKRSTKKTSDKGAVIHAGATAITVGIVLAIAALMAGHIALWGRLPSGTIIGTTEVGWLTRAEARARVAQEVEEFLQTPRAVQYGEQTRQFSPRDLGLRYDVDAAIDEAMVIGPTQSLFRSFNIMLRGKAVPLPTIIDSAQLSSQLLDHFGIKEKAPKNAALAVEKGVISIRPEEKGFTLDMEEIATQLQKQTAAPMIVTLKEIPAAIAAADWQPLIQRAQEAIQKPIPLFWKEKKLFEFHLEKHLDWLLPTADRIELAKPMVHEFIEEEIVPRLDIAAGSATIQKDGDAIMIEGHAKKGQKFVRDHFLAQLQDGVNFGMQDIALIVEVVEPAIEVDAGLQALGIRELIAVGHTDFTGSPPNRINNIKVGLARYNGRLIPPGETFSFNKHLGPVTANEGYRQELVIKPEGTIPEYGGGLCQVSSTMFRAALYAGFPIVERYPHSYAVPYYARPGGQGLDATIYPGSKDLKFTNDTGGHVLLQTFTEGTNAYINVFGTSDGRTVELSDYKTWDSIPPPEPIIAETTDLPPGEKKQVDREHAGLSASWVRTIRRGEEVFEETIQIKYRPWPARFLVGIAQQKENKETVRVTEGALSE